MDAIEVTCDLPYGSTCPVTQIIVSEESPCTWERKLCVRCKPDGINSAKIRVQSNGLPSHCVANFENPP